MKKEENAEAEGPSKAKEVFTNIVSTLYGLFAAIPGMDTQDLYAENTSLAFNDGETEITSLQGKVCTWIYRIIILIFIIRAAKTYGDVAGVTS